MLDRWAGDVTSSLRSVVEELVATRVLAAESALSTALIARDESENVQVDEQVNVIDGELREHAIAAARATAIRDREMPAVNAALDAVVRTGRTGYTPSRRTGRPTADDAGTGADN